MQRIILTRFFLFSLFSPLSLSDELKTMRIVISQIIFPLTHLRLGVCKFKKPKITRVIITGYTDLHLSKNIR